MYCSLQLLSRYMRRSDIGEDDTWDLFTVIRKWCKDKFCKINAMI